MSSGFGFGVDYRSHRVTSIFQIRPLAQVQMVHNVRNWIREYQDWISKLRLTPETLLEANLSTASSGCRIIHNFIEKARKLVKESRQTRQATKYGCVGSSKNKHPITDSQDAIKMWTSLNFTPEESQIIEFLENSCANKKFKHHPEIGGLATSLLRFVGTTLENEPVTHTNLFMFLQEIGVFLPWENRVQYDEHLLLPIAQHSRSLMGLAAGVDIAKDTAIEDSMKDLRKDWGEMSVFCVDSIDAKEVDDGISLEHIEGQNEYWVHVHVANPTAFLQKDNIMSKMAAHMTETVYMPESNWPMLPPTMTQKHFSLQNNRPVLTASIRLNTEGEIVDTKVQNGFIRNVKHLTPDVLTSMLGFVGQEKKKSILTVGGQIPKAAVRKAKISELTAKDIENLKTLEVLARKRLARRSQAGGHHFYSDSPDISIYSGGKGPGLPVALPSRRTARFFSGDPVIQIIAREFTSPFGDDENSSVLVREMMLLCCEIAALWCKERNIPTLYRGTLDNPNLGDRERFIEEVLKPATDEKGKVPMLLARKALRLGGVSALASQPLTHKYIGAPQYAKATSPLRRYGDMVTHWQIEAALREEARTGTSVVVPPDARDFQDGDRKWLAFSKQEIEAIISRLLPREKAIISAKSQAVEHWSAMYFFRALEFGEAPVPEELTIMLEGDGGTGETVSGTLGEYGLRCQMIQPSLCGFGWDGNYGTPLYREGLLSKSANYRILKDGGIGWRIGDWWKVRLHSVNIYLRAIYVEPIRLVSREIPIE